MAEPRVLQPEVVQLVRQRLPGDAHPQRPGVGEVRQAPAPRLVLLPEDDLLLRPVLRLPRPHPPLKRPPNSGVQLRMPAHHLLVQRHRPQPRARLQQRHDLLREDPRQRVRPPTPPRLPPLRRRPRIRFDPVRRRRAEPRLRPGQRGAAPLPVCHVELHLVVRDLSARHPASLRSKGKHQVRASRNHLRLSHPDCRWLLILIVALHCGAGIEAHRLGPCVSRTFQGANAKSFPLG